MRNTFRIAVLMLAAVQPLIAQGGGGRSGRAGAPPARDTTPSRQTPDGTVMDFNNQDITTVLRAIAEAGNLNVTLASMPALNVSLRVQMKMTPQEARDILRSVAEINGITVTDGPSIISLVGPPPAARTPATPNLTAAQLAQQAAMNRVLVVNMIRLKHATASTLAPTLMSLFTGTGVGGGAVNNNVGGRGAGGLGNVGGAAGNAGGGRGGRAGGAAGGGAAGGGGAGGRGAGGGGAGGGAINFGAGGGGIQQALTQAFGGALGIVRPFSDMRIMAEPSTNSLMVLSTAEDFAVLQTLVGGIDLRPLQVLIEVTIAQVQRTHDLDVGISGSIRKDGGTTSNVTKTTVGSTTTTTTTGKTDTSTIALLPSAAGAKDFIAQLMSGHGNINQAVALNALQTRGEVRVLSLPVIIAQNNVQAVISVGSQVPFVSVSQTVPNDPTGRVQTIQYQNVGTTLTIVPVINPDGYVNLTIDQTNNDVTSNLLFDAPIINNREASTQIFVRDGQTSVLGGLADNTSNNSTSGIPILSSIPFIGSWLFGNTTQHKDATELYLFLTPHIISSDEDIDRMRNAIQSTSEMLKSVPLHALNPTGDTLFIGVKKDSTKKPPPDSAGKPRKPPPPDQAPVPAPRDTSMFGNLPSLPRDENPLD